MEKNLMFNEQCTECGNTTMANDEQRGEIVCTKCGLVANSQIFSSNPEWRAYNVEEINKRSRVKIHKTNWNTKDIQTVIGGKYLDFDGNPLDFSDQVNYTRLSKIDSRSHDNIIQRLIIVKIDLKRIRSHMGFSHDVYESALTLYQLALQKNMIKGRSKIEMLSAALYLASRKKKAAITIKDISKAANIPVKKLARNIRIFLRFIDMKRIIQDPVNMVHRISDRLELTMLTRKVAVEILGDAREKRLFIGKSPISLAAAALYIATVKTGERRTQQQIAKAAQTTPITIRKRFKELINKLEIENLEFKRGGAGKPVFISDPKEFFIRNTRLAKT